MDVTHNFRVVPFHRRSRSNLHVLVLVSIFFRPDVLAAMFAFVQLLAQALVLRCVPSVLQLRGTSSYTCISILLLLMLIHASIRLSSIRQAQRDERAQDRAVRVFEHARRRRSRDHPAGRQAPHNAHHDDRRVAAAHSDQPPGAQVPGPLQLAVCSFRVTVTVSGAPTRLYAPIFTRLVSR